MAIPTAQSFESQIERGKGHTRSGHLKEVIRLLKRYETNPSDDVLLELRTAVDVWSRKDPKEFRNVNSVGQNNAAYALFFEVNAEFFRRGFRSGTGAATRVVFVPFAPPPISNLRIVSRSCSLSALSTSIVR